MQKKPDYTASKLRRLTRPKQGSFETKQNIVWLTNEDRLHPFERLAPDIWSSGVSGDPTKECPRFRSIGTKKYINAYMLKSSTKGTSWYGKDNSGKLIKSWAQVQDLIDHGWGEGMDAIDSLSMSISEEIKTNPQIMPSRKRGRVFGDSGGEFSLDRFYTRGFEEAWLDKKRILRGQGPVVSLMFNISTSCTTSARSGMWRGVVALALADALSEAGYSVEIVMAHLTKPKKKEDGIDVFLTQLKAPEEPLRLHVLSSAVSMATFRTIGFMETCLSHSDAEIDGYFGMPYKEAFTVPSNWGLEGRPLLLSACWNEEEARTTCKSAIKHLIK
jgi:hypothetical protein